MLTAALGVLLAGAAVPMAAPAEAAARPTAPPARICGNADVLDGPGKAPSGAVTVPAGDNSGVDFRTAGATYWFAPGEHTLGSDQFGQIIPGDGSTFIGAPGAVLNGQHRNSYAFTQHATDVTIEHLTIENFGAPGGNNNEGVVNHDAGDDWTISNNTVVGNAGAGVFLGSGNVLRQNCLKDNGQYGFSSYKPMVSGANAVTDLVLDRNEIVGNNADDWETRVSGCGCTGGGKFWDVGAARVTDNYVHDNASVGLWADTNNVDMLFDGNWFENNDGEALFYEISYNAAIRNNVFIGNAIEKGRSFAARGDGFPVAAVYLSEAGGDSRLSSATTGTSNLEISNNLFQDNWGGVTLWENADRFCGSPANTSGSYCTRVDPAATLSTCAQGPIDHAPYVDDCRWKTQNVQVHGNEFRMDPTDAALGDCDPAFCGRNALLSNWGTYPSWSPYMARTVQDAITYKQNNGFFDNRYSGTWAFTAYETGTPISLSAWQSAPYDQDSGSSLDGEVTSTASPSTASPSTGSTAPQTPAGSASSSSSPASPSSPAAGTSGAANTPKGFEAGTDDMASWFFSQVATSTAQAHGGTHSLAVTEGGPFWGVLEAWPGRSAVSGGSDYTVSAWARAATTAENLSLGVYWVDANGMSIGWTPVASGSSAPGSWSPISGTVTVPQGAATAVLHVTSSGGTEGTVQYLDDLSVTPAR